MWGVTAMAALAWTQTTKEFVYIEKTADTQDTCTFSIRKEKNANDLIVTYKDEQYMIKADSNYSASACEIRRRLNDEKITFACTSGKMVCTSSTGSVELSMEDLPWHQTPFSLKSFATSAKKELQFYMATLFDEKEKKDAMSGSMLKMVARKSKQEQITLAGGEFPCVKVTITLPGLKSLFWKITYWYRLSDGIVVRYEDVRGGPGTPKTIGTLVREAVQ
jgi:hypothetical protein